QREQALSEDDLTAALMQLYSYVYTVPPETVREAAYQRVLAMRYSDEWVAAGCALDDPLLPKERAALVACYTALRAAVQPQPSG
ncbi:MAG TPA: hypothetical protein VFU35_12965, partial [Jatrophihabitans sp.]|nr:hypothetical protein [Jatrophihabitans sp.]